LEDLAATERQLKRLRDRGLLTPDLHQTLDSLLRVERSRITQGAAPVRTTTQPDVQFVEPPLVEPLEATLVDEQVDSAPSESPPATAPAPPFAAPHPLDPTPGDSPHPLDAPDPVVSSADSAQPPRRIARRTLADLLQGFMEEKNIRWGELLSGLLIVGSAVGLVISLRATLSAAIPYFPALLFMLGTAAIHGAGIYTLKRWNLRSTSRGVLIIGSLLIPLNFLAACVLAGSGEQMRPLNDPAYWTAIAVGLAAFGAMTYFTTRALMGAGWLRLALAILGPSAGQLFINRLGDEWSTLQGAAALCLLPLTGYLFATFGQLQRGVVWKRLSAARAQQTVLVFGVAIFSLLTALALYLVKSPSPGAVLTSLSPMLSVAIAALLAGGLFLHARCTAKALAASRLLGTTVAVFSGLLLFGVVALAWPRSELLMAVGLINAIVLASMALVGRLPLLHSAAMASLALAGVIVFHLAQSHLSIEPIPPGSFLWRCLLMGRSSIALATVAAVGCAAAWACGRFGRRRAALHYRWSAIGVAGVGVAVALYAGFSPLGEDASLAAPLLIGYAATLLWAGSGRLPAGMQLTSDERTGLSWAGAGLLLIAFFQALGWNTWVQEALADRGLTPHRPLLTAAICHATICVALAGIGMWMVRRTGGFLIRHSFIGPMLLAALIVSGVAAPTVLYVPEATQSLERPVVAQAFAAAAFYALCLAGVWLAGSLALKQRDVFAFFQTILTASAALAVLAAGLAWERYNGAIVDVRFVPIQIGAIALWAISWTAIRRSTVNWRAARRLLVPGYPTVDQALLGVGVAAVSVLAIAIIVPGVSAEVFSTHWPAPEIWTSALINATSANTLLAIFAITVALIAASWEKINTAALAGLALCGGGIACWIAAQFAEGIAVASALRWTLGIWLLFGTAILCNRRRITRAVASIGFTRGLPLGRADAPIFIAYLLLLAGMPIVSFTIQVVIRSITNQPIGGPLPDTFFANLGSSVSYLGPLIMIAIAFWAFAIVEKTSAFAWGAAGLTQMMATLGYLLMRPTGASLGEEAVFLFQANAIALGLFALLWRGLSSFTLNRSDATDPQLQIHNGIAAAVGAIGALWAIALMLSDPATKSNVLLQLSRWPSYLALATPTGLWLWVMRRDAFAWGNAAATSALLFAGLVASTLHVALPAEPWVGYATLNAACFLGAAIGIALVANAQHRTTLRRCALSWANGLCAAGVILAVLSIAGDPINWRPSTMLVAGAMLWCLLGLVSSSAFYSYASIGATQLGVIVFFARGFRLRDEQMVIDSVYTTFAVSSLIAMWWQALEVWRQQTGKPLSRFFGAQVFWAIAAVLLTLLVNGFGLFLCSVVRPHIVGLDFSHVSGWVNLVLLGALLTIAMWDGRRSFPLPCLYVFGLAALALALDKAEDIYAAPANALDEGLAVRVTFSSVGVLLGGYVAFTGWLWLRGLNISQAATRWGVPLTIAGLERASAWLPVASVLGAIAATLISTFADYGFADRGARVLAAFGPALAALGLGLQAQQSRRRFFQMLALGLAAYSALLLSWADLAGGWSPELVLARVIRFVVVLGSLSAIYPLGLGRLVSDSWRQSLRMASLGCIIGAGLALVVTLGLEVAFFGRIAGYSGAPIDAGAFIAVCVSMLLLIGMLIGIAVAPSRDPLQLALPARTVYVYGAQMIGALLAAHIFLSRPELFSGQIRQFWPHIVLMIAGAGIGLGQVFKRFNLPVLSDPLQYAAAVLPLLPVAAIWVLARFETFSLDSLGVNKPFLLVMVGVVYASLAAVRRSFPAALAAGLAGNGALWFVLADRGFSIWNNPQFWLIPPAVCTLIAAQIQRRRLDPKLLTSVRYGAVAVIYLSSTIDMILAAKDLPLWPTMLLMGLSVAGVLAGMVLRLRPLLFFGAFFTFLSIVSMVWHAARLIEHVWPWFAFGMGLGVCILALFGLFELKREELKSWINKVKTWES